jgi:hypothetical protein
VEYNFSKPINKLLAPTELDSNTWVSEVKGIRGNKQPLSSAGLHALRDEYTRTIEPARALAAETLSLEHKLSDLVIYRSRLDAKINRNFEVFTPTDFLAAITQHICAALSTGGRAKSDFLSVAQLLPRGRKGWFGYYQPGRHAPQPPRPLPLAPALSCNGIKPALVSGSFRPPSQSDWVRYSGANAPCPEQPRRLNGGTYEAYRFEPSGFHAGGSHDRCGGRCASSDHRHFPRTVK